MRKDLGEKHMLPMLDIKTGHNHSPHVVILGAGASRACCPKGDRNHSKLPLMNDFISTLRLTELVSKFGENPKDNFEAIYSRLHKAKASEILQNLNDKIRQYFSAIEIPDGPTLYDFLLVSLRKKDLIVTFNWDPLLPQAYRRWRHLGDVLPEIVFLHGNVDLGVDRKNKSYGFLFDEPYAGRKLEPTQLLYPVDEKDYNSDPFVAEQWRIATNYLRQAYFVTIFGYSAPATDVEARSLLLKAWRDNKTKTLAQFEIIDVRDKNDIEESWADFLADIHGGATGTFDNNILLRHPRRSCESFAFATLQQQPWHEEPIPKCESLFDLEKWITPLIEEENSGKLADRSHH